MNVMSRAVDEHLVHVVGVARLDRRDLAAQARRALEHGRHAILRERLGILGARLHYQHRPRIDVGNEAEEVQSDLGLHHLRQQHHLAAWAGLSTSIGSRW